MSELSSKSWNAEFWRGTHGKNHRGFTTPHSAQIPVQAVRGHLCPPRESFLCGPTWDWEPRCWKDGLSDCMCCGVFLKIICFTQGSVIYPWCFPRVGGYSHPPLQHQSSHTVFYPQGPLFISPCALPTLAGCSRRLRLRSVCERLSLGVHLRFQFAHITFPNYSGSADNASAHFILANWLTSHSPRENCPCVWSKGRVRLLPCQAQRGALGLRDSQGFC